MTRVLFIGNSYTYEQVGSEVALAEKLPTVTAPEPAHPPLPSRIRPANDVLGAVAGITGAAEPAWHVEEG